MEGDGLADELLDRLASCRLRRRGRAGRDSRRPSSRPHARGKRSRPVARRDRFSCGSDGDDVVLRARSRFVHATTGCRLCWVRMILGGLVEMACRSAYGWSVERREAIVAGAGQAGLAAVAVLKRGGFDVIVLERGPAVAMRWRERYDELRLNTLRVFSTLPGYRFERRHGCYPRSWAISSATPRITGSRFASRPSCVGWRSPRTAVGV